MFDENKRYICNHCEKPASVYLFDKQTNEWITVCNTCYLNKYRGEKYNWLPVIDKYNNKSNDEEDTNKTLANEIIKNRKLEQTINYIHEYLCSEFNDYARSNAEGRPPLLNDDEFERLNTEYDFIIKKIKEKAILELKNSKGDELV